MAATARSFLGSLKKSVLITAQKKVAAATYHFDTMMNFSNKAGSNDDGYFKIKETNYSKLVDREFDYEDWHKKRSHSSGFLLTRAKNTPPPTDRFEIKCRFNNNPLTYCLDYKSLSNHYEKWHKDEIKYGLRCKACGNFYFAEDFYRHPCRNITYLYQAALDLNEDALDKLKDYLHPSAYDILKCRVDIARRAAKKKKATKKHQ